MDYERLIREADQVPFEGWDFGVFWGRFVEAEPSWEFSKLLRTHMQRSSSMLDLGTGGGEFLSSAKTVRRFRPKQSPRPMCEPLYGRKMWAYRAGHERDEQDGQ
jgi:hypothetical protein